MNQEKYDALLDGLIRFSADGDDIQFWIVFDDVAKMLGIDYTKGVTVAQGQELWDTITRIVGMMLQNGFIAFDYIGKTNKRIAWPEQDPKQVMTEIRNRWIEHKGKFPDVNFIVWFHNNKVKPLNQ